MDFNRLLLKADPPLKAPIELCFEKNPMMQGKIIEEDVKTF